MISNRGRPAWTSVQSNQTLLTYYISFKAIPLKRAQINTVFELKSTDIYGRIKCIKCLQQCNCFICKDWLKQYKRNPARTEVWLTESKCFVSSGIPYVQLRTNDNILIMFPEDIHYQQSGKSILYESLKLDLVVILYIFNIKNFQPW